MVQPNACKSCGREVRGDYPECYDCWSKHNRAKTNANFADTKSSGLASKVVESKQTTNRELVKPNFDASFDCEAVLLEKCWKRVHEFEPVPTQSQSASLTATLFIQLHSKW